MRYKPVRADYATTRIPDSPMLISFFFEALDFPFHGGK